jgi:hypothetical protein
LKEPQKPKGRPKKGEENDIGRNKDFTILEALSATGIFKT